MPAPPPTIGFAKHVRSVFARYSQIHGPLLAKGLSFSLVMAGVPLLFILATVGSYIAKANLVSVVELELLRFLPGGYRQTLIQTITRYASRPGSLSVVSVLILLFVVNTLFFDIHRAVSAALGAKVSIGKGRLLATLSNTTFLLLVYGATLVTLGVRLTNAHMNVSPLLLSAGARLVATATITVSLYGVYRVAAGSRLRFFPTLIVSMAGATSWQIVSAAGSYVTAISGSRFVIYGVLTYAVFYLIYMRILAEIVIHGALWIHEMHGEKNKGFTATEVSVQ